MNEIDSNKSDQLNKPNEIKLTRLFAAPVRAVWSAWTDEEQVAKWWGPRGFSISTLSKDLKPGGSWKYTMHGPDGVDYPNTIQYLEVEENRKLVYDHGSTEDSPPLFRVTVVFSQVNESTRMEMTMTLPSAEAVEETRMIIRKAGGESTWDRLAEYLERRSSGKEKFVINRSFDAPIALLFKMWTDPDHFSRWLAPAGFEMRFIRCELHTGGSSFYCMEGANMKMYGRTHYLEIRNPDRIVYTQQFCDEDEKVTRHPMSATWPETMLTTVELHEEGSQRTRVTITWEGFGEMTREEIETFINARNGMTQGWTGSFDKLEAQIASVTAEKTPKHSQAWSLN